MGRSPCCSKEGMNRGAWTAAEDKVLTDYIKLHGEGKWRNIPKEAGLRRCGKSCRLRWMNYLRPGIKRGNISPDEEDLIIRLHKLLGNRWSLIAGRLPGRTDNEIKNYWNTNLSKREKGKERRPKSNQSKVDKKPIDKKMNENSISSTVIRTKASRCREVFVALKDNQQHRTENRDRNLTRSPPMDANLAHYTNSNIQAEAESSDGSLTTLSSSKEENSLDFIVDVCAAGENIDVSEILASDFTKLSHDFKVGISEMGNVTQEDEQAFLFPEEMEQNWSSGSYNYYAQAEYNLDSDFGSLVNFLESAEEWLI